MGKTILVILLVAGCAKTVGGECDDSGDCKPGLFCGQVGAQKNKCTMSCAADLLLSAKIAHTDVCRMQFGKDAFCGISGYCVWADPSQVTDPCEGRCNSLMKCVEGRCEMK